MEKKKREVLGAKQALVRPNFASDLSVPAGGCRSLQLCVLSRRSREGRGNGLHAGRRSLSWRCSGDAQRFLGILRQREVTFSVRNLWKGSISDATVVRTNIGEIACGYDFKKHNSYLVFAYWDRRRQHLTASFCDLTRTEAKAKDAIRILDRLTKRANAAAWHDSG
jgi:hypothetical protein